jgi:DNA helicase-2/ATP-dependent DNA helicase PcrA
MQGAFKKAYGELNEAQKLAVDTIEGPVLVIAGPGTGKTQLLTTRVANILNKTDTLPANILCLTFTDSAAATMRQRLTNIIGQAAYDVTISTYHAFGSELIRRYPEYFAASADLRPVDDLTIDSCLRDILACLPYSNPLRHDIFLHDIKTFISDCKRALITPEGVKRIAYENEQFLQSTTKLIQEHLAGLVKLNKSSVPLFAKLMSDTAKLPSPKPNTNVVSLRVVWQQQLEAAISHFSETGKTSEVTKWKNTWLAKDETGNFIASGLDQVRKLRAAATIYEQYLSELARLGLYDYDDMILRTIRGLEDHADLRYSLQEQYLYILLDEFQDTNGAQAHLIELLTDNPVNESRPNIMAVGDDDQAIYAFQGANYSHMLSFYERYHNVVVVSLTENYRSHVEILNLASSIVNQIGQRLHDYFPQADKHLVAKAKGLPNHAGIERYEFLSDLSQNAWIAKKISELVVGGVASSSIAVLAPKHVYLESLVPFLHEQKLPVHYEKRENVLDDAVVRYLTTMSRLVLALSAHDYNYADSLWPEILSFRFWGLSTERLWQLSWEADETHSNWANVLCEHEDTKPVALFFIRLSQIVAAEPMERILDFLIGSESVDLSLSDTWRSPFYDYYFGTLKNEADDTADLWQLLSNLTVLRQRLREYRASELTPLNLADFVKFVDAHQAADIKILNTNPHQEAPDAVELMTTYKAKGQEFEAVFLLACSDEVWGSKARSLSSHLSLPENLRFIRYSGATEDERLRLLYVALTRAKTQLYLTSYTSSYTGRATTHLKYLDEHDNEAGELISPFLPAGRQKIHAADVTPPALPELTVYWQGVHYKAAQKPRLQALLTPRLEHFQLTPTALNCFTDVANDGPTDFFIKSLLRFPVAPTPAGQYGSAIHETLEWLASYAKEHSKLPNTRQALQFFEKHLDAKRLSEPKVSLLKQRGRASLQSYLKQRADTIKASGFTEYSFKNEGVFVGDAHLSGKIDKLIVNPSEKTLIIVDYKTGKSYERWAREAKLHKFRQQLYFYKLLVERSHTFAGYTIEDAYLEFIEPDNSGKISELHLNFDSAYLKHVEKLIEAVWQHILQLKLPDVSGYSQDLKGIEQFEQDLIDGTI